MDWKGWLSLAGTILGILLAIPQAKKLWDDWYGEREPVDTRFQLAFPQSEKDRVLLTFDKVNVTIPGTFEHTVQKYADACPFEERRRQLLYDPQGMNEYWGLLQWHMAIQATIATILVVFIWLVLGAALEFAPTPSNHPPRDWWDYLLMSVLLGIWTFVFGTWAFFAHRGARRYKAAREIAEKYLAYLRANDIRVQREFTQSVWMHSHPSRSSIETHGSADRMA